MENSDQIEALRKKISENINPHLPEGRTYYHSYYTYDGMGYHSRSGLYYLKDEMPCNDGTEDLKDILRKIRRDIASLIKYLPHFSKILLIFKKGQDLEIEVYDPAMLMEDIKRGLIETFTYRRFKNCNKIETTVDYTTPDSKTIDIEVFEKISGDKDSFEFDNSFVDDDITYLNYALNKELKDLYLKFENNTLTVESKTPFEKWNIKKRSTEKKIHGIDETDISQVFEFMESFDGDKIAQAIDIINRNDSFKVIAEKRYLNFVRARTDNNLATINDFSKDIFKRSEINTILGKHFGKDFISYSYMDKELKAIIDFMGSVVKNHMDIDDYIKEAAGTKSEDELVALLNKYIDGVKEGISSDLKLFSHGWYGRICNKLLDIQLNRVMFEKTDFDDANRSMVLKEYMFFLGIIADSQIYFDIFQSSTPELTEVFWLLKEVPDSSWGDTTQKFPEYPLKYKRKGYTRSHDFDEWKEI